GKLSTEKTEAWIGVDDGVLYIGARCWDSQPDSIVGLMGRRDNFANSDEFQIGIDAYNDKRSGFFFVINPVGAIIDGTISNDSWLDENWDGIWEAKAQIDDQGWTLEMRIPFSQLRFDKQDEYVWGIGIGRKIQRRDEQSFTTFYPRGESVLASKFAELHGIKNINPPRRMEFIPYAASGYSSLPDEKDNPYYLGSDAYGRVGGDIKIGIGSNLTIDATINPDFGQVESDPASLNLSDFETIYGEKRPFFVEGSSIFTFGTGGPSNRMGFNFSEPDFFYSRRVGQPPHGWIETDGWVKSPSNSSILGAAKLSGKIGSDLSIGAFSAITEREFAEVDEDSVAFAHEVEPVAYFNMFRMLKEFNNGNQGFGILATRVDRNFEADYLTEVLSKNSTAFGLDGWTFIGKERDWALSAWLGRTIINGTKDYITDLQHYPQHYFQKPDAQHVEVDPTITTLSGNGARVILNKEKGNVTVNAALGYIDPSFNSNDLGLTYRSDRLNKHVVIGYNWREPGKVLRRSDLHVAHSTNHNFDGEKINEMFFFFGSTQLINYSSLSFFSGWGPKTISDTHLRGGPMVISPDGYFIEFGYDSDYRKNIVYGGGTDFGGTPYGQKSFGGYLWSSVKLGTQLTMNLEPSFNRYTELAQYIMEIEDSTRIDMFGKRYILAQLDNKRFSASIRLNYTFNPRLSLQTYIQPYVVSGTYSDYKEFEKPRTYDFIHYDEENEWIKYDEENDSYYISNTSGHDLDTQFRYSSFIANAVLRWEFRPSSTLYFVWTRNANDWKTEGNTELGNGVTNLLSLKTNNLFALKVTYWFGA
ncbi:MAG: carbohydrate binding family 9 domain-containing protein, partial [Candidatus Marinimicrobia bacterium]|nr:carbohydrate binding family 9 domain-containing protein [Candidatus Neomarinimicrobiota bacterium]